MGELFLAMLLEAESRPVDEILVTAWRAAGEEGFRENRTSETSAGPSTTQAIYAARSAC